MRAQTAQEPIAPSAPTITVNARLVVLDVVVTDAAGKPVDNLSAGDFQVFEDGRQQVIRSVEPPSEHTLPAATLDAGATAVFDPAAPASFGHSPATVLILDQLNTHFADSSFARRTLHDYLARQSALLPQPTTLLSVYDNRFKLIRGFTRDRDALLKALATAPTEYAWKLEIGGNSSTDYGPVERLDQSLRALEQIAQTYARIPGRKNLIWVGGGFPTLDPTTLDGDDATEVKNALRHVTDVLLDTRVTLYAVDPTSTAPGLSEITNADQADAASAMGGLSAGIDSFGSGDDFDKLGPATGGRVIRGRNDIDKLIASSVDLGANFYTIAYTPSSAAEISAKARRIKVVCLRPGLTATTREGYFPGASQQAITTSTAAYDLATAAEGTMPLNGLHVTAQRDPQGMLDTYLVRVAAADLTWKPRDDGSLTAAVYVMSVSLNAKNKMLEHTVHPMKASARPGTDVHDPKRLADFEFTATPSGKATTLRFIVRDSSTGRMGSFDLPATKR